MRKTTVLLFLLLSLITTPLYAEGKLGVVLMHGKGGTSLPRSPIGQLSSFLEAQGILVSAPDMPWSRKRGFDKTYQDAMGEINDAIEDLKNDGANVIVVGGHSIGANAALGYAARHQVAAVLAIAPGHVPDIEGFQSKIEYDWERAKNLIDDGKGNDITSFNDLNQGRILYVETTPNIYLSWYNPTGSAVIPDNTAKLKPDTALLWVVGSNDRMYDRGKAYAFNNAPQHPHNAYIVVDGGHRATPKKSKDDILDWLRALQQL